MISICCEDGKPKTPCSHLDNDLLTDEECGHLDILCFLFVYDRKKLDRIKEIVNSFDTQPEKIKEKCNKIGIMRTYLRLLKGSSHFKFQFPQMTLNNVSV